MLLGNPEYLFDEIDDDEALASISASRPRHQVADEAVHTPRIVESNGRSRDLDLLESEDIVRLVLQEDRRGLRGALKDAAGVAEASEWFAEAHASGGRVLFVGAGNSGRLGVIESTECQSDFGTDPEKVTAAIAGGPSTMFYPESGVENRANEGKDHASNLVAGDLLIAIAATGVNPYVQAALEQASEQVFERS